MSTDYLGYLYGSAVAAGGAMGYVKKRQGAAALLYDSLIGDNLRRWEGSFQPEFLFQDFLFRINLVYWYFFLCYLNLKKVFLSYLNLKKSFFKF